ncbi:carboxylate--amine ligase, partial [Campylobacter jejuni]|nr:carboxylate--amine ligase [Campylobacter jejuni]MCW1864133.1 carboxylate--amine ligase [Campylobacter jejuni]
KNIKTAIFKTLDAFNICFGACHIEIKLHDNTVKIIEIASRMGGWRDVLVKNSYEIDYLQLLIQSSLKQELKK